MPDMRNWVGNFEESIMIRCESSENHNIGDGGDICISNHRAYL